jgi:exodeoxyribonuclease VII large subunit
LRSLSPKNILARGYSIVKKSGTILRQASEVRPNDNLEIQLHRGRIDSKVTKVKYDNQEKE